MRSRLSALNQRMFGNVGGSIKKIARVLCWIGIVASFIGGIVSGFMISARMWGIRSNSFVTSGASRDTSGASFGTILLSILLCILATALYTLVGGFLSWLASLMTYGFGELVEMAVRDRNRSAAPRPQRSRAPTPRYARQTSDDDWDGYR